MKVIILDSDVMKSIIEGNNTNKVIDKLSIIKEDVQITTPLSSFLHALMTSNSNSSIKKVQQLMSVLKIQSDDTDFLDNKKVKIKLAEFAQQSEVI